SCSMYILVFLEYSNSIGALLGSRPRVRGRLAPPPGVLATGLYPRRGWSARLTSDRHFAIVIAGMVARSVLGRSALWLAIYSLCLVFVCSFILFEVLDVDGSDFPSSATQAVAAEAPHADIRRLHLEHPLDP